MSLPTEENNLPLFKYNSDVTSQFLIQTNDLQEYVQVPNICDDLLTSLEDGTVTWTLGGLPILLNGQNDSQQLFINQTDNEGSLEEYSTQDALEDILEQDTSAIIQQNNIGSLEISDKNFLLENGLFLNEQEAVTPTCELLDNTESSIEASEECVNSEIQSSDITSQEAYVDVSGIISQQPILNSDFLLNVQEIENSPNVIFNKKKTFKKNSIINESVSLLSDSIESSNQNEQIFSNETDQNSIFNCNDSLTSLVKVLNVDGSATILNLDGSLFNDKSVSKNTVEEFEVTELPVDDEPDSTVAGDADSLNIDDLATIITAYQCKKCEFTCNDRDQFLTHYKDVHINTQPLMVNQILEVQPEFLVQNSVDVQNILINNDTNRIVKRIPNDKNVQTVNILCTNGEISLLKSKKDELLLTNLNGLDVNVPNNDQQSGEQQINILQTDNELPLNLQSTKLICGNGHYTGVTFVAKEEREKKIMRVKKKKKSTKKLNVLNIPQEPILYVSNLLLEGNPIENIESNNVSSKNESVDSDILEKQFIFLCSQCADQFLTIEECKEHMIKVHKLCAIENVEKESAPVEEISEKVQKKDPLHIPYEKNKKMIDKILCQDVLKARRHRCPVRGCQYRFAKLELLARHEACHVPGTRTQFRCPECSEMQPSWRVCSIHLWRCHQLDIDLYACPFCSFKASTSVKLKYHAKIHCEEREFVCPDCSQGFKQPSQLRNHRVIHLDKRPRWYTQKHCDICSKMFADSKCLKKHIQAVHSKLKPFICNVCGHSCARKAMLQLHLRQHTGEKPYSCNFCFYKTGDHNSFRRHAMRHSGTRPYKCPHCNYTAIQSISYKNHIANKHPGKSGSYNCTECSFKTVNEIVFSNHVNDHLNKFMNKKRKWETEILGQDMNSSSSEMSNSNENLIFSISRGSKKNISRMKNIDLDDDETQTCFLSLSDLTDEQTIDTGGITIPADPDDPEPLHI